jgi:Gene product 88
MAIRISKTSKLDGVRSWSLEARATCPGAIGKDGELVPACAGCYAVGGNYRFDNVKLPRQENREDWKRAEWVDDMVAALRNDRYFRWFDSGDVYALPLAEKILEVMRRTPDVKHWLPTRMHKFAKFQPVLAAMAALPNVVVRPSSDSVTGEFVAGVHGSTIVPDTSPRAGVQTCFAAFNNGQCGSCRACYSKDVAVIGYVAHGRSMAGVVKRALAA